MKPETTKTPDTDIFRYVVRIPDMSFWSLHDTERDARKECAKVNRKGLSGHEVYAEHTDGGMTGPYPAL